MQDIFCRKQAEPFFTFKEAAEALGLKYWQIQRAAKQGVIPTYTFASSRKRVRLSEIVAVIAATGRNENQQQPASESEAIVGAMGPAPSRDSAAAPSPSPGDEQSSSDANNSNSKQR